MTTPRTQRSAAPLTNASLLERRGFLAGLVASASVLSACSGEGLGSVLGGQPAKSTGPARAALLAPVTGRAPQLGQIMRNAATLGGNTLSDTGEMAFFDTGDSPETAAAAALLAVGAGAQMIVGPLFGSQVMAVAKTVGPKVPVLTLSNDVSVAGNGVFVLGVTPEQSARAILTFAARRGLDTVGSIKKHKSAYLMAVGGSAYLVSRAIKGSKVVGFEELGMEAIYEFEVQDMPVTVAVDAEGQSVHHLAPLVWQEKIKREGLLEKA